MKKFSHVLLALGLALVSLASRSAMANECDSRVYDTTGKLSNVADVDSSANTLTRDGADVRIRVISVDELKSAGNVDRYAAKMIKRCTSWQAPSGNLKDNMIVIVVTPPVIEDGKPTTYSGIKISKYGPYAALDSKVPDIRHQMSPLLKTDIASALKTGMNAIHGVIAVGVQSPVPKRFESKQPSAPVQPVQVIVNQPKPADLSFLKWFAVLLGLGGVVFIVFFVMRKRSETKGAKEAASVAYKSCVTLAKSQNGSLADMEVVLQALKSQLHGDEYASLNRKFDSAKTAFRAAAGEMLTGDTVTPVREGLDASQYVSIERKYLRMKRDLDQSGSSIATLGDELNRLEALIEASSTTFQEAERQCIMAQTAVGNQKTAGYDVALLEQSLLTLQTDLASAKTAKEEKKFVEFSRICRSISEESSRIVSDARSLTNECERVAREVESFGSDVSSAQTAANGSSESVQSIETEFGAGSAKDVSHLPANIASKMRLAGIALAAARATIANKRVAATREKLEEGRELLAAVRSALGEIQSCRNRLSSARRNVQRRSPSVESYSRTTGNGGGSHHTTVIRENTVIERDNSSFMDGVAGAVVGSVIADALLDSGRHHRRDADEEDQPRRGRYDNDSDFGMIGSSGRDDDSDDRDADSDLGMMGSSGRDDDSSDRDDDSDDRDDDSSSSDSSDSDRDD